MSITGLSMILASLLLLPVGMGIVHLFIPSRWRREFIWVSVVLLVLLGLEAAFFAPRFSEIRLPGELAHQVGLLLALLDLVLVGYFLVVGVQNRHPVLIILSLFQGAGLIYLEFIHSAGAITAPELVFDRLSALFVLIICIVGGLITLYALPYMKEHTRHHSAPGGGSPRIFFTVFLVFLGAMNALVFSNHLMWLYLFWEITTLCSFLLIGYDRTPEARSNALRALWMNSVGGAAFVLACLILVMLDKPLYLDSLVRGTANSSTMLLVIGLLVLAGMTKAAQMPFQSWLLGAMVAPTPVSALLHSSTMVKAGVYLILRTVPAAAGTDFALLICLCGAFTFVATAFLAIGQSNAKRILAYSTVSNLGLIVVCAGLATPLSYLAAMLLILFHALSKGVLFMAVGAVEQSIGSREVEKMEGLLAGHPFLASVILAGAATMFLPPTGMLLGKWLSLQVSAPYLAVYILLALGSVATIIFWSKWMGRVIQELPAFSWKRETVVPEYEVSLLLPLLLVPLISLFIYPVGGFLLQEGLQAPTLSGGQAAALEALNRLVIWGGVVLLILPLAHWLLSRSHRASLKEAYLCGDNYGGLTDDTFHVMSDRPASISLAGYYFPGWFGEGRLTPYLNSGAILLILVMLGVTWL